MVEPKPGIDQHESANPLILSVIRT